MSAIFVLVTVVLLLVVGGAALSQAYQTSGSSSAQLDDIMDILGHGLELTQVIPIVLVVVLALAVLGVFSRI
jgi:di/tricarboxylate transporter